MALLVVSGVVAVQQHDQQRLDKRRKTYRLLFPYDLNGDAVLNFIRMISGTLRTSRMRFLGTPTITFEVWSSTSTGIEHFVKVPWQYADFIMNQMLGLVPGIRYELVDEPRR